MEAFGSPLGGLTEDRFEDVLQVCVAGVRVCYLLG